MSSIIDFPLPKTIKWWKWIDLDQVHTNAIFSTSYFCIVLLKYFSIVSSKMVELLSFVNWRICLILFRISLAWFCAWRKASWKKENSLNKNSKFNVQQQQKKVISILDLPHRTFHGHYPEHPGRQFEIVNKVNYINELILLDVIFDLNLQIYHLFLIVVELVRLI